MIGLAFFFLNFLSLAFLFDLIKNANNKTSVSKLLSKGQEGELTLDNGNFGKLSLTQQGDLTNANV